MLTIFTFVSFYRSKNEHLEIRFSFFFALARFYDCRFGRIFSSHSSVSSHIIDFMPKILLRFYFSIPNFIFSEDYLFCFFIFLQIAAESSFLSSKYLGILSGDLDCLKTTATFLFNFGFIKFFINSD